MRSSRMASSMLAAAAFVTVLSLPLTSEAAPPRSDPILQFSILAAQPSPTSGAGPLIPSPPGNTYEYLFSKVYGASLAETIPVEVCLVLVNNPNGWTWDDTVEVQAPTPGVPGVSVSPTSWSFDQTSAVRNESTYPNASDDPACQPGTVTIDTGALTPAGALPQTLASNTHFKMSGTGTSNNPDAGRGKTESTLNEPNSIKIKVQVTDPASISRVSCYLTNSEGDVLQKCNGDLANASAEVDGTFAIVANKKGKAVATNPGQFYYNLLWKNDTGAAQTVSVSVVKSGLVPHGAQAVHWLLIPTSSGVDLDDFATVNMGNPAGTTGQLDNIVVPSGDTLYVTYHLEWSGVGATAPACGACGNALNVPVSVTGTVTGSFGGPDVCTAGALGFLQ
jgi:hypothetical protein